MSPVIFIGIVPLLLLALYGFFWEPSITWLSTRGFEKRPDANADVEWQFSPEKIRVWSENAEGLRSWSSYVKVVQTNDGFLFYPIKNLYHWVPFSAFDSPDCIEKVRVLLRQNGYSPDGRTFER